MAITLCLIIGTLLIGIFLYNEFFYKEPVIPNSVKATVINCELSQSRVAQKMRAEDSPFDLYDITYEFLDVNGETVQAVETVRYREDVGTIKTMIIKRMRNGHKELQEVDLSKPKGTWFFLAGGIVSYMLILLFYFTDKRPDFLQNLRDYGFYFIFAFFFIILSVFSFERYSAYVKLMNNSKQVNKFPAEVIEHIKRNPKKEKSPCAAVYAYEDENGILRKYESVYYTKKQDPIGTKKIIHFDKYTNKFISRRVVKSYQTCGIWATMTGSFIIVLFLVKAIFA